MSAFSMGNRAKMGIPHQVFLDRSSLFSYLSIGSFFTNIVDYIYKEHREGSVMKSTTIQKIKQYRDYVPGDFVVERQRSEGDLLVRCAPLGNSE